MSTKSAIPSIRTRQPALDRVLDAMKQNLDSITGQARNMERLEPLPDSASLQDLIAQHNKLLERLQ